MTDKQFKIYVVILLRLVLIAIVNLLGGLIATSISRSRSTASINEEIINATDKFTTNVYDNLKKLPTVDTLIGSLKNNL